MSSDDPIESAAAGITKGIIELSSEKIKEWIRKFKDRKLAFIQDKSVIEVVKEQYASGESKFYSKYIKNKDILFLTRLGLTLRKIENDIERVTNLQQKILKKYEVRGLHISYFVQNGILNRYIGLLIEDISSEEELEEKILNILENIEKHTLFVTGQDKPERVIQSALTIVSSHNPTIFIVSGIGSASKIVKECSQKLESLMTNYELEKVSGGKKEILFFKRKVKI
ncbi:hypothetical protein FJZ19_02240 [Candidatus Pacearchaeota archaeon]|nr:hypothetical protein [Candidatus Pacearchaeota archaeon]